MKADRHGIYHIPENEKDMWVCGTGNCKQKGEFIRHEEFDKADKTEVKQSGICKKHALIWQKDCEACTARILGKDADK